MEQSDIQKLREYYSSTLYGEKIRQQQIDLDYYNDRFPLNDIIISPVTIMRTGKARRLIDSPADHIVTDNPQAFRIKIKNTATEDAANERITTMLNTKWLQAFKRQNPNVFKQFVKYDLLMGEAWGQIVHNPLFKRGVKEDVLPVILRIPDPIMVLASPNEDENGVPEHIILFYERTPYIIKQNFPAFTNPLKAGEKHKKLTATWIEYWDNGQRYFEADGQVLLDDDNPYGFVPFVHKLAGFGSEGYEGKMEELVVGRLRFSRDTLRRECAIISSMDYAIHSFSNRSFDVQGTEMHPVPADFWKNYLSGVGLGHTLPTGVTVTRSVEALPELQLFQYLATINLQLELEDPLVTEGIPIGTSGRQQSMTLASALLRYSTIIENTNNAFSTLLGMGLRIIDKIPGQLPSELKREDLNENYEITVELKASDPLEDDRKATLGSRLVSQGEIDMTTNLIEFKGYTEERAKQIMINTLRDKVLFQSPDVAELIGLRAAEKSGMAGDLQLLRERRQLVEKGQGIEDTVSPTEQQRRAGETKTGEGFDLIDTSLKQRGARQAPERFTRG